MNEFSVALDGRGQCAGRDGACRNRVSAKITLTYCDCTEQGADICDFTCDYRDVNHVLLCAECTAKVRPWPTFTRYEIWGP